MSQQSFTSFRTLFKAISGFLCLMPIGGWLAKHKIIDIFPPLGGDAKDTLAMTAMTLIAGAAAVLPWKLNFGKRRNRFAVIAFCICLASVVLYFGLCQAYVISVPLPNDNTITVSIGGVRSQLAQDNFSPATTDTRLVQEQPDEEGVQKLWTHSSIMLVRFGLFLSYLGMILPINFIVGLYASSKH